MNAIAQKIGSFTSGSRFSFGVVLVVVGATGYVTGGFAGRDKDIQAVRNEVEKVNLRLEGIKEDIAEVKTELKDQWRRTEMIDLWQDFGERNPSLDLPRIRKG